MEIFGYLWLIKHFIIVCHLKEICSLFVLGITHLFNTNSISNRITPHSSVGNLIHNIITQPHFRMQSLHAASTRLKYSEILMS